MEALVLKYFVSWTSVIAVGVFCALCGVAGTRLDGKDISIKQVVDGMLMGALVGLTTYPILTANVKQDESILFLLLVISVLSPTVLRYIKDKGWGLISSKLGLKED